MLELGISQAQSQFTKLLDQEVVILDKKSNTKKAVILPFDEYEKLIRRTTKEELKEGVFSKFSGVLKSDFVTEDEKYKAIVQ